jgi:hypothetical protein
MVEHYQLKRGVALVFLCVAIAFIISSVTSIRWVESKELDNSVGSYYIGLYNWRLSGHPTAGDSPDYDWDQAGQAPWQWNENLLGSQSDWKDAGKGALALGAIGVIAAGLAAIALVIQLLRPEWSKAPAAFMAFFCGIALLLGACIYEGMRPKWGGDIGYMWPIGLYLAAGCAAELAAIIAWSADYIPPAAAFYGAAPGTPRGRAK